MSEEKKLYNILHVYDVDSGFGDPVECKDIIGTVLATKEEADKFVEKWDKPVIYEKPYGDLYCHGISIEEANLVDINSFVPYKEDENPYGYAIRNRDA